MSSIILAENVLENATLTATSTASGYDKENLKDRRPWTKWKATSTVTQNIDVDIGSSTTIDTFGFSGHNFGDVRPSVAYFYWDGFAWVSMGGYSTPVTNNTYIVKFNSQTAVKFRVQFLAPTAAVEVGIIFIGAATTMPEPVSAPFSWKTESIVANGAINKSGELLGADVRHNPININPIWKNILKSFYDSDFKDLWDTYLKTLKPFFFAWDYDNYPDDILYLRMDPAGSFALPSTVAAYIDEINLTFNGVN